MSFLQIASWNIIHLSNNDPKKPNQSAYALADHIEMAGVDAIALQEIYVTDTDEVVRLFPGQPPIPNSAHSDRRNRDLDIVCYLLEEHMGEPWTYLILPNRKVGDTSQLCAVMWNATRLREEGVHRLPVDHGVTGARLWDRAPHAIKLTRTMKVWKRLADGTSAQEDEDKSIALIPLHMKSNWGGAAKNRPVREKEAKTLCQQLDWVRENVDESLILIGDTNILNNEEPAIECFVGHGLVDLNDMDSPTYWSRKYDYAPFDRAFVAEGRREFEYTRQYVLRSADLEEHDRELSDHYMIKISVKSYVDDADPR